MGLRERLEAKVDRRGPDECWPWTGAFAGNGYGYVRDDAGRIRPAARMVLVLDGRDPGPGGLTRHRCDNPPCCNPAHLEPGTQADNMRDMAVRGRAGARKLTPENVAEIRTLRATMSMQKIADRYGVTKTAVYKIVHGLNWAHLEGAA